MLEILEILPGELRCKLGKKPSVLGIWASEPKYLIFSDVSHIPVYVVQAGSEEKLQKLQKDTFELHAALPEKIPAPIAIFYDTHGQCYLVQQGVDGVPWFSLRHRLRIDFQWEGIVNQSIQALSEFHNAMASNEDWTKSINLKDYYKKLENSFKATEEAKTENRSSISSHCTAILSQYSDLDGFIQHGDFSVNNLMFRDDGTSIIDFEQFGRVYLPLHDEFNLVASLLRLHDSPDEKIARVIWAKILQDCEHRFPIGSDVINVLLLMHITWWLVEIHGQERRLQRKAVYLRALNYAESELMANNPYFVEKVILMLSE